MSTISNLLQQFRAQSKTSQASLAKILGIEQATVSRIESGSLQPSASLIEKIKRLPLEKLRLSPTSSKIKLVPKQQTSTFMDLKISTLQIAPEGLSGDVCSVDKISKNKICLLIADTVGHGLNASRMAFGLEVAYKALIATFGEKLITPRLLQDSINTGIEKTKSNWIGPPSLLTGTFNLDTHLLEIFNSGLPEPYFFSKSEIRPMNRISTPTLLPANQTMFNEVLGQGDALLFFTDGFSELSGKAAESSLKMRFQKAAKLFRGDAEPIMKALIEPHIEEGFTGVIDDATALIVSRTKS